MSEKIEASKSAELLIKTKNGLSIEVGTPYCTAKKWAEITGISVRAIDEQMKKGHISFIQHVPKGTRYINCIIESKKCLQASQPWN